MFFEMMAAAALARLGIRVVNAVASIEPVKRAITPPMDAAARGMETAGAHASSAVQKAQTKARARRVIGQLQEQLDAGAMGEQEFALRARSVLDKAELDLSALDATLAARLSRIRATDGATGNASSASRPASRTASNARQTQTGTSGTSSSSTQTPSSTTYHCRCGRLIDLNADECDFCGSTNYTKLARSREQAHSLAPSQANITAPSVGEARGTQVRSDGRPVRLFVLSTSRPCEDLCRHLDEHGIACEVITVDLLDNGDRKHAEVEMAEIAGRVIYPLLVKGDAHVSGYNVARIERLLGI